MFRRSSVQGAAAILILIARWWGSPNYPWFWEFTRMYRTYWKLLLSQLWLITWKRSRLKSARGRSMGPGWCPDAALPSSFSHRALDSVAFLALMWDSGYRACFTRKANSHHGVRSPCWGFVTWAWLTSPVAEVRFQLPRRISLCGLVKTNTQKHLEPVVTGWLAQSPRPTKHPLSGLSKPRNSFPEAGGQVQTSLRGKVKILY